MLSAALISLFVLGYGSVAGLMTTTIIQAPAFERRYPHDLRLGNTVYQAKEAHFHVDLTYAHYRATSLDNARAQRDAQRVLGF